MRDLFENVPHDNDGGGNFQMDPQQKATRRRTSFSRDIEEQATFAIGLVRRGKKSGVRDALADEYGNFLVWDDVVKCAGEAYNVALDWYE